MIPALPASQVLFETMDKATGRDLMDVTENYNNPIPRSEPNGDQDKQ